MSFGYGEESPYAGALGPELVANSDMSDISDVIVNFASVALVSGSLEVTDISAGRGRAGKPFEAVAGKVYLLEMVVSGGSSNSFYLRPARGLVLNTQDGQQTLSSVIGKMEVIFRALFSGTYYVCAMGDAASGSTIQVSSMSAKEVIGL